MTSIVKRAVRFCAHAIDDVIFPPHCLVSGRPLRDVPTRLPEIDDDVLDVFTPSVSPIELMLMAQRHVGADDLNVSSFFALWSVDSNTEKAMYAIKYNGRTKLAVEMGKLLGSVLADEERKADTVIPVPIHRARRRERGYNQAEHIGNGVAVSLGIPMLPAIRRTRYTGTQTSLSEQQRLQNVVGAFEIIDKQSVKGARVMLVDDVLTTGSTLNACAYALLDAGARRVDAITLCAA